MQLQEYHAHSLAKANTLSSFQAMNHIPLGSVLAALNGDRIKFVLVGAYGLAGWIKKPRATEDVDVVVFRQHLKKAVRSLLAAFPEVELDDQPIVFRFRDKTTKDVVIDVIKPFELLYQQALKETTTTMAEGQTTRVPTLEMALALKFAPMISIHRRDRDKHQDAHDFMYMVDSNPDIDLEKLAVFGELVYPGGGKEIVEKVQQVRTKGKLVL